MIERPRNERNMNFHDFLRYHGYDEKPFDYVLKQLDEDLAVRWPYRVKGPLSRAALTDVWGSFAPMSLKRALELQATPPEPERNRAENGYQPEDDCEVPF